MPISQANDYFNERGFFLIAWNGDAICMARCCVSVIILPFHAE